MEGDPMTLADLIVGLRDKGYLTEAASERADHLLETMENVQPWYVRVMVGFSAWLASMLLLGSVAGISLASDGATFIVGLVYVVAAIAVRKRSGNAFLVQSSLAVSLAGQGLLLYGIAALSKGGIESLEVILVASIVVSSILFVVFPDRIHRVLMVMSVAVALVILIYKWRMNVVIPFIGPALAAALILLQKTQMRVVANGWGHLVRPLMNGLMISAFGCLLISTIYILPELQIDFEFYPYPWISTLLLGALYMYLGSEILNTIAVGSSFAAKLVAYLLMISVVAAAWAVPGLLLALVVIMLGASYGNRVFVGAGVAFLVLFLATYFYGIQLTMLTKAITLFAAGAAILLSRWWLLRMFSADLFEGREYV